MYYILNAITPKDNSFNQFYDAYHGCLSYIYNIAAEKGSSLPLTVDDFCD